MPVFQSRGVDFLTVAAVVRPDRRPGIAQGLFGTFMIAILVALFAFPIGIATAVYLEEYAPDNPLTRFINVNIRNLAGVPSVVYGLLGLTVFVAFFAAVGAGNGRNLLAAMLTLGVLVLPIVIITSAEALRAVPNAIREAGYGVGASRWEVTSKLVLPAAVPGHPDRDGPGAGPGARRDRPAPPHRRRHRRVLDADGRLDRRPADRAVHRAAADGLPVVEAAAGGVPGTGRGGHHRPAGRDPARPTPSPSILRNRYERTW